MYPVVDIPFENRAPIPERQSICVCYLLVGFEFSQKYNVPKLSVNKSRKGKTIDILRPQPIDAIVQFHGQRPVIQ